MIIQQIESLIDYGKILECSRKSISYCETVRYFKANKSNLSIITSKQVANLRELYKQADFTQSSSVRNQTWNSGHLRKKTFQ